MINQIEKYYFEIKNAENELTNFVQAFADEVKHTGKILGFSMIEYRFLNEDTDDNEYDNEDDNVDENVFIYFINVHKSRINDYIDALQSQSVNEYESPTEFLNDLVEEGIVDNFTFVPIDYLTEETVIKVEDIISESPICAFM